MACPQDQVDRRNLRSSSRSPSFPAENVATNTSSALKGGRKGAQNQPLQEAKKKGRMKLNKSSDEDMVSQLQSLDLSLEATLTATALVCDESLEDFHCLWDKDFPECPLRLAVVREKLTHYRLQERCVTVQARAASDEEILLVHSQEYLDLMKSTQTMAQEELKALADSYDSVFLHPNFFSCACLAAGSVLQLVDKVLAGEVLNGLALVRPPGHHAHRDKMNGYCMFNHLGIAARYAQHKHAAERVLIVDWDIHHGQGTQFLFEEDPSVLYFSVHRYQDRSFWPNLLESSSSAVGRAQGEGFNINVPWNQIGMQDADYISVFLHLLLPVAFEFQPNLVLVAAGFDSVVGDPKGEMATSPACFAHLTHLLMGLAGGKLILSLEGGYNLRSLAEGVCTALKILLGDPCPKLASPVTPCLSALESVSETIGAHCKYWKNLWHYGSGDLSPEEEKEQADREMLSPEALDALLDATMVEIMRPLPKDRTGLVYDEMMKEHYNLWDSCHPEVPQRISRIYQRHVDLGLVSRCCRLPSRSATMDELQMCHSLDYIKSLQSTVDMKPRELHKKGSEYNSIFFSPKSYDCALLAAGCTFSAVEAVLTGKVRNAVAIVRPPGHHAERSTACGFCFFNSVALAARYAQKLADKPIRVLILDWDIHHGNGTQHMFESDPSVLYVSLHRYDHGTFFPNSEDADYDKVGCGAGQGFNVNVAWNGSRMGDPEYLTAFQQLVMPLAYEFNPELVVVSAGFDAAQGDPLGGCLVTPEGYAHMTHLLLGLAAGRVVLVLEGGYNLTSISESMALCTRTLLGEAPPMLAKLKSPQPSALQSIGNTIHAHRKYWKSLRLNVPKYLGAEEESATTRSLSVSPSENQNTSPKKDVQKGRDQRLPAHLVTSGKRSPSLPVTADKGDERGQGSAAHPASPGKGDRLLAQAATAKEDDRKSQRLPDSPVKDEERGPRSSALPVSPGKDHGWMAVEETRGHQIPPFRNIMDSGEPSAILKSQQFPETPVIASGRVKHDKGKLSAGDIGQHEDTRAVQSADEICTCLETLHLSQDSPGTPASLVPSLSAYQNPVSPPVGGARKKVWPHTVSPESIRASSASVSPGAASETGIEGSKGAREVKEKNLQVAGLNEEEQLEGASGWNDPGNSRSLAQLFGNSLEADSTLYAVTPLPWCPHLESVQPVPFSGLDVLQPCGECGSKVENWVCLVCYKVYCGRYVNEHMLTHSLSSGHLLVLSYSDLSVWCYGCDSYVYHQVILEAKRVAYRMKFNEEMPFYDDDIF
ncbi:histone deacetylase 6 isoform X3 [Rhinatrema bivittatum]|uniref:histone deacetylase 6 isoform X3 n=1 Tax=Rhinatrema bivittatum TaxID=194408 RepID=UPI00112AF7CE|nr:histone deacetylase 6 isoform X3 [Rhinatrema bivittatum]